MTTQELKEYINKTLGNNIRCLLPSYWWRRLFGLVVDKIDGVENKVTTNTKNISSVAQNISLVEKKTVQIVNSKNELDDLTSPNGSLASVVTPEKVFSFKDCYQPTPEECSSDEQIAKNFHKFTRVKEVRLFDSAITSYNAFNVYFRSQNIDEYLILECSGRDSRLRYVYKIDGSQGQRTHYLYGTSGDFSSSVESKFNEYLKTNDFRYASSQDSFLISDDLDVLDTICMVCEPESSEVFIKEDEWSRLVKENEAVTTVDLALSDNSTNPVQNKVIKAYVDSKFDNIDLPIDVSMSDTSTNAVQNKVIKSYVDKNISRSYIIITVDKVVALDGYDSEYKYKQILLQPNEPTVVYVSSFRLDTGSDGSKVTNIRLRNLDTSYAYSFQGMFADAYSEIEELDVSHFVTKDVVEMTYMFARCSSLKHLDVSSFNTKKVRDISTMFYMCSSLTSLDLSSFDLSSVTSSDKYVNNTFGGCTLLSTLILGNGFFKAPVSGTADFSDLKNWTNESVIASLVTNSYDRVANELPVLTLKLSNATKAVLTEEHVTIMNNKGYTIN